MFKQLEHTIQDKFEKSGDWWLPNNPNEMVTGTLQFDPDEGIWLNLVGGFEKWMHTNELIHTDILHGFTVDGMECTLYDCTGSEMLNFPGITRQEFRSKYLFLGHHFNSVDDVLFRSYEVNYEYFEEWLERFPYKLKTSRGEGKFEYNLTWPSRIYMKSQLEGLDGEITISNTLSTSESTAKSLRIVQEAYIRYQPFNPQHLDNCIKLFFDLQRFLTLMMSESTFPRRIVALVHISEEGSSNPSPVGVYYQLPSKPILKRLYYHEMLMPFEVLSEQAPMLLERWISNADQMQPVYDQFFGYLFRPDMYLEHRFLSLVNALESYHRAMFTGNYVSNEDYIGYYKSLVGAIPQAAPRPLRDALNSRLKYGNEYSLKKRLWKLFHHLGDDLAELVSIKPEIFLKKIVNTRNYLTHHDDSLKPLILTNEEIFHACRRLRIMLTVLLLKSLGIDDSLIRDQVSKNRNIRPWDVEEEQMP